MSSPLWKYGGTLNGRIGPVWADAQGGIGVYYFGGTYFYTYVSPSYVSGYGWDYTYEAGHVFCLGEDSGHYPSYRYITSDTSYVEQATIDLTDIDIVYFCCRLNTSSAMPNTVRTLQTNQPIEIKANISAFGDNTYGVVLPKIFTNGFVQTDIDRQVIVQGTLFNDATYRISGVPWNLSPLPGRVRSSPTAANHIGPGDADGADKLYKNGQVAILDIPALIPEVANNVTVTLPGFRWLAQGYIDSDLRVELYERPGRAWQRNYMAMHTSKLVGNHTVKFTLSIEKLT